MGLYYLPALIMFTSLGTLIPSGWGTTATLPLSVASAAVVLFLVNMLRKDASMARYPEHAEWVRRTGFLFPSPIGLLRSLPLVFRTPEDHQIHGISQVARAPRSTRVSPPDQFGE